MDRIIPFDKAIEETADQKRSLLIGNGFSANFFNFSTLVKKANFPEDSPIKNIFDTLGTADFEKVMHHLDTTKSIVEFYNQSDLSKEIKNDSQKIRKSLITSIQDLHPQKHIIPDEKYDHLYKFINKFHNIFSLNYDLLLYWAIMKSKEFSDGFLSGKNDGCFRGPFSESDPCTFFNLHGSLLLFQREGQTFKVINNGGTNIIDSVSHEIKKNNFPLYVSEGSSKKKMEKINSSSYLKSCYEKFCSDINSIFVYGHSASDNDEHIYKSIFGRLKKQNERIEKANTIASNRYYGKRFRIKKTIVDSNGLPITNRGIIKNIEEKEHYLLNLKKRRDKGTLKPPHLYFGIYKPTNNTINDIEAQLVKFQKSTNSKMGYTFFDSEEANVWGPS